MSAAASDGGADRRHPSITRHGWLTLRPLAEMLQAAVARDLVRGGRGQSLLDVGCNVKPYAPFFAPVAVEHVGVDVAPGPYVDVVAPAESLPFPDGRFDVVLCTQTLEHITDPAAAVREAQRVLKPGGVLLLSTHGVAVYHPFPHDYWRWTQEGLEKLVRDSGRWSELRLEEAGGTVACFGYLIAFYAGSALNARPLAPLRAAVVAAINVVFGALDRVVPLHYPRKYTLIANFLVVARKA